MIWLALIYSLLAMAIVLFTFKLIRRQKAIDRRIEELRQRIVSSNPDA